MLELQRLSIQQIGCKAFGRKSCMKVQDTEGVCHDGYISVLTSVGSYTPAKGRTDMHTRLDN
jgi:hypothetical protein